jgi:hypothetical protein
MAIATITGYVALIDVLGFREIVGRDAHGEYLATVSNVISEVQGQRLQYVLFSDSVIVNTIGGDDDDLYLLVRSCSALMAALLDGRIPTRGAIAHGRFDRSEGQQGVIIAGRPIIEAFSYEQRQNWLGAVLCPSVLRVNDFAERCAFPSTETYRTGREYLEGAKWAVVVQRYKKIPFHSTHSALGDDYDGYAIVPVRSQTVTPKELFDGFREMSQMLNALKFQAPDPAAQAKYTKTRRFLTDIRNRWPNIDNSK